MNNPAPGPAGDALDWLHEQGKQRSEAVPELNVEETLFKVRAADDHRARMIDLVNDARAGDPEAITGLVAELTPMLRTVARATGLSAPDSEDVVQTVWLILLQHLDSIHTPAALTSWLVATARREAWRVRTASHRQAPADSESLISTADETVDSEELVITADTRRKLREAFRTLRASWENS